MTDKAYSLIEELIVTLQLAPGAVLSEVVLATRLSTGRTPVREALQRLSRDGLVNILPRRGVLVSDMDLSAQLRLLEVRRELERLMARGAAKRATPDERKEFAEIAQGMRLAAEKEDGLAFMRLDQQFNMLISAASRNEFATRSMGLMHGLSDASGTNTTRRLLICPWPRACMRRSPKPSPSRTSRPPAPPPMR